MTVTALGSYAAGEIPEPWVHTFEDATGAAINLTGYTVKVTYKIDTGSQIVRSGVLVALGATGQAQYTWVAGDIAVAGVMRGEMWVGNGANRYARSFTMLISDALGGTAPSI